MQERREENKDKKSFLRGREAEGARKFFLPSCVILLRKSIVQRREPPRTGREPRKKWYDNVEVLTSSIIVDWRSPTLHENNGMELH